MVFKGFSEKSIETWGFLEDKLKKRKKLYCFSCSFCIWFDSLEAIIIFSTKFDSLEAFAVSAEFGSLAKFLSLFK